MNKQQLKIFMGVLWKKIRVPVIYLMILVIGCAVAFLAASGNSIARLIGIGFLWMVVLFFVGIWMFFIAMNILDWVKMEWARAGSKARIAELDKEICNNSAYLKEAKSE